MNISILIIYSGKTQMYMIVFCHKAVSWNVLRDDANGKRKINTTQVDNDNTYTLLLH